MLRRDLFKAIAGIAGGGTTFEERRRAFVSHYAQTWSNGPCNIVIGLGVNDCLRGGDVLSELSINGDDRIAWRLVG